MVTNVKLSFKLLSPAVLDHRKIDEYELTKVRNIEIIKCCNFTFSFMSNRKFVNLTSCKTYTDIVVAINAFLCCVNNVQIIHSIKIDSISYLLFSKFYPLDAYVGNEQFFIKTHPRFKGVTVKHKSTNVISNIFKSHKMVFMGLKSLEQLNPFISCIINA